MPIAFLRAASMLILSKTKWLAQREDQKAQKTPLKGQGAA
jgi:hypothetical protein